MSEVSATELATRIAIDATELEHRLQATRDALEQKQARINKLEFLLTYARTCDKQAGDIAWNQQYAGDCDEAVAVGPNATGANALIVEDSND